jgi:hypothetical protein
VVFGCNIDKNKALELYLLAINNKETTIYQKLTNLYLLEETKMNLITKY